MSGSALNRKILAAADRVLPEAWKLSRAMFEKPELGYQEFFALAALTGFLASHGFKITRGVAGIETAFVAERKGKKGGKLAFLAEMDALPEIGHACGHHLIAGGSAGAAAALALAFDELPGTLQVIGCPAEEGGGGKIHLANAGVFDGLSAALIVHPDRRTEIFKRSMGVVEMELEFRGRAAHASAYPEDGVNALDAVIQTFNGVSAMRQQMREKARVHGIITHGGKAANIIPDYARAVFMARGMTLAETMVMVEKVEACAKAGALATGATLEVTSHLDVMYAPYIPNRALGEAFRQALDEIGVAVDQGPEDEHIGSTDVGNACLRAPVLHPQIAVPGAREGVHSIAFAKAAGGEAGKKMLDQAIRSLALTGARVLTEPALRESILADHRAMVKTQTAGMKKGAGSRKQGARS